MSHDTSSFFFGILILACAVPSVDAQPRRLIATDSSCDNCRLSLHHVADLTGPNVIREPLAVARMPDGSVVLSYYPDGDQLFAFARDGRFQGLYANTGAGPGEVRYVTHLSTTEGDSLVAWESGNFRVSVYTPEGHYSRSFRLPGRVWDAGIYPDGHLAINAEFGTPERFGLPLHTLTPDGAFLASFAGAQGGLARPDMPYLGLRRLDVNSAGHMWTSQTTAYELTEWTRDGTPVRTLVRDVPWFEPYFGRRIIDPDLPFPPWVKDVRTLDETHIAVVLHVASEDWQDHLGDPHTTPSGQVVYPYWDMARVHDSVVEILDTDSERVVFSKRLAHTYVTGFLDSSHLLTYQEGETGEPWVSIHRLSMSGR